MWMRPLNKKPDLGGRGGGTGNFAPMRDLPANRGGYKRPSDPRAVPAPVKQPAKSPLLLPLPIIPLAPWDYWTQLKDQWSGFEKVYDCPGQVNCSGTVNPAAPYATRPSTYVVPGTCPPSTCQNHGTAYVTFPDAAAVVPGVGAYVTHYNKRSITTGNVDLVWRRIATGVPAPQTVPQYSPVPENVPDPFPETMPAPQWRPRHDPWGEPANEPHPYASPVPHRTPAHWPIGWPIDVPLPEFPPVAPPRPGVRPRPRPRPRPNEQAKPRLRLYEAPATEITLSPRFQPRVRPRTHRKVRDRQPKARVPYWMARALKLYHGATEVKDFLESLADAMPDKPCKGLPGFAMAACVIENLDKVDPWKAAENVIKNEIEDQIIGRGSGKLSDASSGARKAGYHGPNTTQSTSHVRSTSKMLNF